MLEGGEDARFLVRRMVILASEDIGNADPQALVVATAAAAAVEHVGMPEAVHALSQATIYLALAPKSKAATRSIGAAIDHVRRHGAAAPPPQIRSKAVGYDSPHDHPGHLSPQEVAPDEVAGARFYEPDEMESELRRAAGGDPAGAGAVEGACSPWLWRPARPRVASRRRSLNGIDEEGWRARIAPCCRVFAIPSTVWTISRTPRPGRGCRGPRQFVPHLDESSGTPVDACTAGKPRPPRGPTRFPHRCRSAGAAERQLHAPRGAPPILRHRPHGAPPIARHPLSTRLAQSTRCG